MKKKSHTFCIVCCGSCRNHCFDFICRQGELIIYDLQFRISGGDRSPVSDRNVWRNVPYE